MTRLHIDWTACRGRGGCTELLEGILRSDDWGYPLGEGGSDVVVPTDRLHDAREAVALCPRMALRIQD